MSGLFNLAEAAIRFGVAAAAEKAAEREALEVACEIIETRAKHLIGVPHSFWEPLKPETIDRKNGINSPLLESGAMRDSIEHTVNFPSGFVGSNDDKAVWQELGTSRGIPPRSFLAHAAQESGPEIARATAKIIGSAVGAALSGSRVFAAIEIARMVGEALRPLKEAAEDLVTPEDEHKR